MTDKIVPSNDTKLAKENVHVLAPLPVDNGYDALKTLGVWDSLSMVGVGLEGGLVSLAFLCFALWGHYTIPGADLEVTLLIGIPSLACSLLFIGTAFYHANRLTMLLWKLPRGFVKRNWGIRRACLQYNRRIELARTYASMPGGKDVGPAVRAKWAVERQDLLAGLHSILDDIRQQSRHPVVNELEVAAKSRATVLDKLEKAVNQVPATTGADTQDLSDHVFFANERIRSQEELSKMGAGPDWLENEFRSLESDTTETLTAESAAAST